jgi:hypothetical protein
LLIIGTVFLAQQIFFPNIFADPLMRKIQTADTWGTHVLLIPDRFEAGLPRDEFLARLKRRDLQTPQMVPVR